MELKVVRDQFTGNSTIGKIYINGTFFSDTLEDKTRIIKIPNITAITEGRYEVVINFSNRFKVLMPLLINVPNYEGVRIHWGNYSKDTDGCILLGTRDKGVKDFVGNSRAAFAKFMAQIRKAGKTEKIFITICHQ